MTGLSFSRFESWFLLVREKLRLDGKKRLAFLLFSFNALLIAILLLSVRNDEIRRTIERVYVDIEKQVEQLATIQASELRIVYITQTPTPTTIAVVASTPTPTWTATTAPEPTATLTSTAVPSTPTSPAPTWTATPTPFPASATPTPTSTTGAAAPTATSMPTSTPTTMPTPTNTPSRVPTRAPTATPTETPTPVPTPTPMPTTIILTVASETIAADGSSTTTIRAQVLDQYGQPVPDDTVVRFSTNLGVFWGSPVIDILTRGGIVDVELTSSTTAGTATITAVAEAVSASTSVRFSPVVQISKGVNRGTAPTGSILAYTVLIQNVSAGGEVALLRTLRDTLPAGFSYVPGSTSSIPAAFGGDPQISGQDLIWTPVPVPYSLAPGSTVQVTFQVSALAPPGIYMNSAAVDGDNFAPRNTGTTAPVTLLGPMPSSVTPAQACNDAARAITINGANFAPGATASLGALPLGVTWISEGVLASTVPQNIAAGSYDLVVTNPGGTAATLSGAYTALNCGALDETLDGGYLGTYGAEPVTAERGGDDDQVQVLFLEVPDGLSDPLYVRVYDPDCGGGLDIQNGLAWDTPFTFTLSGGGGTYTHPDARSAHPVAGVGSGTVLATAVFSQDGATDGNWYPFGPFSASDGELVNGKRIFKLGVVGGPEPPFTSGIGFADLNLYNVALSTLPNVNVAPQGARLFAFSWTFLIPPAAGGVLPPVYPFVGPNVTTLVQHNWDYDNVTGSAVLTMTTPLQMIVVPGVNVSGDGEEKTSGYVTLGTERNATWIVSGWVEPIAVANNLVTFWATDQAGVPLAIFARSTNVGSP